jgi:ATP-dependent helicase/nuclease subunit B
MGQGERVEHGVVAWEDRATVDGFWQQFAQQVQAWLLRHGVAMRDAVVLLPFAQHLAIARRAFAALGPWLPRLETTRSLAAGLGPPRLARPGELIGEGALDLLQALSRLRGSGLGSADPRADRLHASQLLELTQALQSAAASLGPQGRSAYWPRVAQVWRREVSVGLESELLRIALEWAQHIGPPATDVLFEHQASAWILLESGRPDPLARAVLSEALVPALRLEVAGPGDLQVASPWRVHEVDEAGSLPAAAAGQVLRLLAQDVRPVLMPATDRALMRQVKALLLPHGVQVQDETGGSLATTGPAAALRHAVRAALLGNMDDLLAWAKSPLAPVGLEGVSHLEAWARRQRVGRWGESVPARAPAQAWRRLLEVTQPLRAGGARRPLHQWLLGLRQMLAACLALEESRWTAHDQATWRACKETLWLSRSPWPGSAAEGLMDQVLDAGEWLDWVDESLQDATPTSEDLGAPHVVITPLNRAALRPFAATVLAGVDAGRWSLGRVAPALLRQSTAAELDLPNLPAAQAQQWAALQQLARLPQVVCVHARHGDGVPLDWAPPLQRMRAAFASPWVDAEEARRPVATTAASASRAQVALPGWLPKRWSASQVAALRDCPYQFFARVRLGLGEADEIDRDPDPRDWGRWLHAVLQVAHELGDPVVHWDAACRQVLEREGVPAQEVWPFLALLQRWGPAYLSWWPAEAKAGRRVAAVERPLEGPVWAEDPLLSSVIWIGRADRVDVLADGSAQLLDFKTGSASSLKARVETDPQLPFYAALLAHLGDPVQDAAYLAVDSKTRSLQALACPDTPQAARELVDGLAEDLRQLHAGEPLRALGEGVACEHCAARGVCRKDDWSSA